MKILCLCFYYNRPKFILNFLESVRGLRYDNYEIAFIDDSSEIPGQPIVEEFFKDEPGILSKFKFYHTNDTIEEKRRRGAIFGQYANIAIQESDAEVAVMTCDDDALYPDYFANLAVYFQENPGVQYAYSHVICFDPRTEDFQVVKQKTEANVPEAYGLPHLNHTHTINPGCNLDSTQVAWRTRCNKEDGIWFPFPQTANLDSVVYGGLDAKHGPCPFTGFIGQFKGAGAHQLGRTGSYDVVDQ